jgi:hypothetical protein
LKTAPGEQRNELLARFVFALPASPTCRTVEHFCGGGVGAHGAHEATRAGGKPRPTFSKILVDFFRE